MMTAPPPAVVDATVPPEGSERQKAVESNSVAESLSHSNSSSSTSSRLLRKSRRLSHKFTDKLRGTKKHQSTLLAALLLTCVICTIVPLLALPGRPKDQHSSPGTGLLTAIALLATHTAVFYSPSETSTYTTSACASEPLLPTATVYTPNSVFIEKRHLEQSARSLRPQTSMAATPEIESLKERIRSLEVKLEKREKDGYILVEDSPWSSPQRLASAQKHAGMSEEVSIATASEWEEELLAEPKNRLALDAFTANDAVKIISSRSAAIADTQVFNLKIPHEGAPITTQGASGRCWLFAATNVFRVALMQTYNLDRFELSQAYLFFWDKLEKANYLLETVLDLADSQESDTAGRLMTSLLASPVGDGGQWDMVANLVQKYGLVPQSLFPDSFNAQNSKTMRALITTKLREDVLRLQELVKNANRDEVKLNAARAAKSAMMQEIHRILVLSLGAPPNPHNNFTWEYYDKDGEFHSLRTSPLEFSKQLSQPSSIQTVGGTDVHRLFSLVHDPRNDMLTHLTVDRLGNVWNGRPVTYVNVDLDTMKTAVIKMLKKGLPVFFGSDVGKYSDRASGIMDTALYDYELGFNVKLGMTKAERLRTGESLMTHAMVLTGAHLHEQTGRPIRWRVENSWGESSGTKGYFVMTDAWFDEFVYQAVVDPAFVSHEVREVLKQDALRLPHWDPMGALA